MSSEEYIPISRLFISKHFSQRLYQRTDGSLEDKFKRLEDLLSSFSGNIRTFQVKNKFYSRTGEVIYELFRFYRNFVLILHCNPSHGEALLVTIYYPHKRINKIGEIKLYFPENLKIIVGNPDWCVNLHRKHISRFDKNDASYIFGNVVVMITLYKLREKLGNY